MSTQRTRRALVVGLGVSGIAACRLLYDLGWLVRANDRSAADSLEPQLRQLPAGTDLALGGHPEAALHDIALVVASPGVPWNLPLLASARARDIEVISEVELAFRRLGNVPLIGVTGSNGKSTVTSLIGAILKANGLRTGVGGNLGDPASALIQDEGCKAQVWELSSFQLEGCTTLRPQVAVLLNISADHLDRHGTLQAYVSAKAGIFARQQDADLAVLNADDPVVRALQPPARAAFFSLEDAGKDACLYEDTLFLAGEPLLPRAELPLTGDHNVANALAAALAAHGLGVGRDTIAAAMRSFTGLPHRHQLVAECAGVRWVDDSKGTNIGAVAAGLAGYPQGRVHLILGGLGKGQDFTELADVAARQTARVYLIGEAVAEIATALGSRCSLEHCGTLETAVKQAATNARSGDVVLLSPACASFDQFRSYAHRGEEFARLVHALPEVV